MGEPLTRLSKEEGLGNEIGAKLSDTFLYLTDLVEKQSTPTRRVTIEEEMMGVTLEKDKETGAITIFFAKTENGFRKLRLYSDGHIEELESRQTEQALKKNFLFRNSKEELVAKLIKSLKQRRMAKKPEIIQTRPWRQRIADALAFLKRK